jgi:formylmethanofuran dehydrogenase subunit D
VAGGIVCVWVDDASSVRLTETWLTEEILTSEFSFEGYTLLRKDKKDLVKTRGGGVAIYVKNNINVIERDDLNMKLFPESIWCELIIKGEKNSAGSLLQTT